MPEEITDQERQLAKKISDLAMIAGWDQAIKSYGADYGISELQIRTLLKKAADYNDKADPSGRIHELEDYKQELRERSVRKGKTPGGDPATPRATEREELSP